MGGGNISHLFSSLGGIRDHKITKILFLCKIILPYFLFESTFYSYTLIDILQPNSELNVIIYSKRMIKVFVLRNKQANELSKSDNSETL